MSNNDVKKGIAIQAKADAEKIEKLAKGLNAHRSVLANLESGQTEIRDAMGIVLDDMSAGEAKYLYDLEVKKTPNELDHTEKSDLNLCTFDHNRFISRLQNNINKYYVISNIFETWFFNNRGREWDNKRGEIENLIQRHFYPVYKENVNYLYDISLKIKSNSKDIIDIYFDNLDKNLNSIKSIYLQGKSDSSDSNAIGIGLHISNLRQIYNNENCDINKYKLILSFSNEEYQIDGKYNQSEYEIDFNTDKNEIINIKDLFYKNQYPINQFPKCKINLYLFISQFSLL